MNPLKNHSNNDVPLLPAPGQPALEEAPTSVSAGREVTVYEKCECSFSNLPYVAQSLIIRYLGFREITRLKRVCKYFCNLVENDKTLERAWIRKFTSPYHYQPKTIVRTKDKQQLRHWLGAFTDMDTIRSLMEHQKHLYFPAQLLFINSKLMSQCKKFKLVEKIEITHCNEVNMVNLSPDDRYLVSASKDKTVKICSQKTDGSWEPTAAISNKKEVVTAKFSPCGRHLMTATEFAAKIYAQDDDGSWKEKITISNRSGWPNSTNFSPDGQYLATAADDNTVKIFGLDEEGQWGVKNTIPHKGTTLSVTFSADGCNLVIFGNDVKICSRVDDGSWIVEGTVHESLSISAKLSCNRRHLVISSLFAAHIYGQGDGSWVKKATVQHKDVISTCRFSADSCHLVTASTDSTAKICNLQDDGSWQEITTIAHDHWVIAADFSANCHHLVTASKDNTAKIYTRKAAGKWEQQACITHTGVVNSAKFSADCFHVVTASDDNTVKISGLQLDGSWLEKATIQHNSKVTSAHFSTDSRHVVTVTIDNKVRITELQKDV
ncbi:F-box/WD repeat-containing protein [Endozoicomonas sp. 8E]|uniref:F-box/WD repeat-containing protein n=1 Tax=Endozoicomonas sp. 8E TaxID=3035692 RepID=UPI0029393252|nr:F-box protein [Endozoicomonas sp. 8E]WOG28268.1 F-box protein [Endozoicomonas sp. 8E]